MLHQAIRTMTERLITILAPQQPSIYLYGSVPLADFRPGWSDIDLLVLTETPITETQAKTLVDLRQTMLAVEPDNPYYRSFEGGMLTKHAFCTGEPDKVISIGVPAASGSPTTMPSTAFAWQNCWTAAYFWRGQTFVQR